MAATHCCAFVCSVKCCEFEMTGLGKMGKGKVGKTDDGCSDPSVSRGLAKALIEGQCDAEQREKLSSPKRWVTRLIGKLHVRQVR